MNDLEMTYPALIERLQVLKEAYNDRDDLPEPLRSAVKDVARTLNGLSQIAANEPLSVPFVENILERVERQYFEFSMPLSLTPETRSEIYKSVSSRTLNAGGPLLQALVMRDAYKHFNLPPLTVLHSTSV